MNLGVLAGFTKPRNISAGDSYPEMKVIYVPNWFTTDILNSNNIDTLLLIDSIAATTLPLKPQALKKGSAIHIAQWGAEQVTIQAQSPTILRVADGLDPITRAQFSVISLIRTNEETDEWIVFGDLASA